MGGNKKEIDGTLKADGDDVELIAEPDQSPETRHLIRDVPFCVANFLSP